MSVIVDRDLSAQTSTSSRREQWFNLLAVVTLIAVIAASWCYANNIWSIADWQLPTAYKGPYAARDQSDILIYSAFPELGAPYEANWNDWPYLEYVPLYLIGVLARGIGIFAALNVALLLAHLMAGVTAYGVARYWKIDIVWAFTSGLAFGLAPFIFAQSPDHPMVVFCWHVPLFLLVWRWLTDEEPIQIPSKKFRVALAVGFISGIQNPYYFAVFCQIVLLTAAAMFLRTRNRNHLIVGVSAVAATVVGFVLINLSPWLNQLQAGRNHAAIVRQFQWVEIYALKVLDFFVPPLNHHWPLFRQFAEWRAKTAILHDEGSYLGIFGTVALAVLVVSVVRAMIKRDRSVPVPALHVFWIFLFFSTGGLNAIAAALGFTYLRAGCRLSLVIFAISIFFAAEWVSRLRLRPQLSLVLAGACCVLILWGQVPSPPSSEEKNIIARQVSADAKFVADLESALPDGAMVFQLPVMDFPEAPLRTETSYDHLRPYLFTKKLRFSFGSMKGRPREQWQHELEKLPLSDALAELKKRGFSALYVSRPGYGEIIGTLEQSLKELGYTQAIENPEHDVFCVVLH
ncbi:MAG: hypothetical protein DME57_02175 [Verrucomicrobia bacterium]|nr:MAG: hypothetical protein DME57_02175 [Verrucomicrobiota bacterium]